MKSAIANLTTQVVKQQKERLVKQGSSALDQLLKSGKTTATTDTTKTTAQKEVIKTKASDLLNNLFSKKKKQEEPQTQTP